MKTDLPYSKILGFRLLVGLFILGFAFPDASVAQLRSRYRVVGRQNYSQYISVTAGTGIANYFGDLCPTGDCFGNLKPQLNLSIRGRINPRISVRGEVQWYRIGASDEEFGDKSRRKRNLSFRADNFEISATGQFDFLQNSLYAERFSRRRVFNLYGFAGLGVTTNNPKARLKGTWYNLRQLQTEGKKYGGLQPVVPVGLGVRIRTGLATDILIEGGYRLTFTDYLDDVSGNYVPAAKFTDPIAQQLSDRRQEYRDNTGEYVSNNLVRGNSDRKDSYFIFSAKFQYTFSEANFRLFKRGQQMRRYRSRYPRYK